MTNPAPSPEQSALYLAVHELYLLKSAEAQANSARIAQEALVIEKAQAVYGALGVDQSKTFAVDNYKITITNKTNFSPANKESLHLLQTLAPECVVTKLELYDTYLRNLRNDAPDLYRKLTPYIASKAAKPYIKISSTTEE